MSIADPPDPASIAYLMDDDGEHPGGGHCAGLPDNSTDRWLLVVDQHVRAFDVLVDYAEANDDGWGLSRPVLFAAHHACEVALKTRMADNTSRTPPREHNLSMLWDLAMANGGASDLTQADRAWISEFVRSMVNLTERGFEGRYPEPIGGTNQYCCLNLVTLRSAVTHLVALVLPDRPSFF